MHRRGWEVTLLAGSTEQDPPAGLVSVDGVDVVRYRIPRSPFGVGRRPRAEAAAMASAIGNKLSNKWDIVHGQAPFSALAIERLLPSDRVGRRVYSLHSPASQELVANSFGNGVASYLRGRAAAWILNGAERRALAGADQVHVLSRYCTRLIADIHGGAAAAKVTEIPWFVESETAPKMDRGEARRRLDWAEYDFHVITVRRLVPRMGIDTLVRANALLPQPARIWVHIIGDGADRETLEQIAQNGARASWVRFHGRLSETDLDMAYAAADVFVLPTVALEGFGLIILEALARGLQVIGTDVGAIPEVLGKVGLHAIVQPGNPAALAERIQTQSATCDSTERRLALARRVREIFPKEHTLDRFQALLARNEHVG
jgi:glycosyltransferase involved in cell wall biosynthesis